MFHDRNITPVKAAEDLNLTDLVAWLETQDPDTKYVYVSHDDCLLARFYKAHGYDRVMVFSNAVYPSGHAEAAPYFPLAPKMNTAAIYASDLNLDYTFGNALKRARRALGIAATANSELAA